MEFWDSTSCCGRGEPVDYFWHQSQQAKDDHISASVDALWNAVQGVPSREWTRIDATAARASFQNMVERAQMGILREPQELRSITRGHPARLFEMRWEHLKARSRTSSGILAVTLHVRLFYAEPEDRANTVIAVLAWEKDTSGTDDQIRRLQDDAADCARDIYLSGAAIGWPFFRSVE